MASAASPRTCRSRGLADIQWLTERLPNLRAVSLSHNLIQTLEPVGRLASLESLNASFNALTSLHGLSHCTGLTALYLANNRCAFSSLRTG